jgi:hypothetical protein
MRRSQRWFGFLPAALQDGIDHVVAAELRATASGIVRRRSRFQRASILVSAKEPLNPIAEGTEHIDLGIVENRETGRIAA